jgi:23S rRNA pseudouridine1911/1915/1917 synthase
MKPQVVFCDNHVLVVDKPPMMVTQKTEGHETSLEEWAKAWVKEKYQKPGAVFLHAIHRLDKEVSGLVLFARTSKALSRLNQAMREGKIEKTYEALVEGVLADNEGTLSHDLEHKEHRAQVGTGKKAVLHYRVLERNKDTTLVEITLETGRYHQIRAQFSAIRHPIVGDKKYGSKMINKKPGIALRNTRLVFPHPISGQSVSYSHIQLSEYGPNTTVT